MEEVNRLQKFWLEFYAGCNSNLIEYLGCQKEKEGYRFTVWAPNARAVAVVGDFSNWQMGVPLKKVPETGLWTVCVKSAQEGQHYKYRIEQSDGTVKLKIDPFALQFEVRPKDASIVRSLPQKKWRDNLWTANRKRHPFERRPINIYEVHFSSWKTKPDGTFYSFQELQETLIPYVKERGYTHIEFMPLMEHPLDESWGYQVTGFFALSSKYGTIEEMQDFIEGAHLQNIGVIMDWVPAHFNLNDYSLPYYDGTAQYEYQDPDRAINKRWGTGQFDLGKQEVRNFLISNASFWLTYFHLDGLRVDAVSSMLYLDYDEGPWKPNQLGTNVNLEGKDFLQEMTQTLREKHPHVLLIAEESTDWSGVTHPVAQGGLGFHYKWNMGWMNDTLRFFEGDPLYRKSHYRLLTFSFMYLFNERYILPFSHDEVVHGKKSLMHKMPGDRYNQFANLRTMEVWRITHPGKKLHFMGNEYGQFLEWRDDQELEWDNEKDELNQRHHHFMYTLNQLYLKERSLWELDHSPEGLQIVEADNEEQTVIAYIRYGKRKRDLLLVILNLTPVERRDFRIGVPYKGTYEELLNTEKEEFGGTWTRGQGAMFTEEIPKNHQPFSLKLILPAMSALIIRPKRHYGVN